MLKLLYCINHELKRSWKFFLVVFMGVIFINVVGGFIQLTNEYRNIQEISNRSNQTELIGKYLLVDLTKIIYNFEMFSILFLVASVILFTFLIWYREWYGKNHTIRKLFILPIPRIYLYISKITVVYLWILLGTVVNFISIGINYLLYLKMIPLECRATKSLAQVLYVDAAINFYLPHDLYSVTMIFLSIIFVLSVISIFILFERVRRKGSILLGLLFIFLSILVLMIPGFYISAMNSKLLMLSSTFSVTELMISILVILSYGWVANYLLNRKVNA